MTESDGSTNETTQVTLRSGSSFITEAVTGPQVTKVSMEGGVGKEKELERGGDSSEEEEQEEEQTPVGRIERSVGSDLYRPDSHPRGGGRSVGPSDGTGQTVG